MRRRWRGYCRFWRADDPDLFQRTETPERRRAVRQELSAPLVADLEIWMREQRAKLSRRNDIAKAMDNMLRRWSAFTRFLDDGRICLSNNAAERGVRGIALGRKSCGSDRGGARASVMYSLAAAPAGVESRVGAHRVFAQLSVALGRDAITSRSDRMRRRACR